MYFGGIGSISCRQNTAYFKVQSLKQILTAIVPHFDMYPLITQKLADYPLFKEIVMKMEKGAHLNKEGAQEIVNLRASLNTGLSEVLKTTFPDTVAVPRPLVSSSLQKENLDPEWLAGFAAGEACFFVDIKESKTHSSGFQVLLRFQVTQHSRDELLMRSLVDYLGCGKYYPSSSGSDGKYQVTKYSDVFEKIIPFFQKHPLLGVKSLDFED